MKLSAGIPLGLLLLCAVLPWALGDKAKVKQGHCPDIKARCMMVEPPVLCKHDYACPGDQKCCELACGTNCTDPVKEGECPHIKIRCMMANPPKLCRSDFACPGDQKCCELACGTNCTAPVKEKAGQCPDITQRCAIPNPPVNCFSDDACPEDKKCCTLACSTDCAHPVKAGMCPAIQARCMMAEPPVLCRSDSACPGEQKCCELACGTNCTDPVKPGFCPQITATCDMLNPPAHCSRDSACPGKQKCCQLSCSTNCTDPVDADGHSFKGYTVNCTAHPGPCTSYNDPVCGMDDITQGNECLLCRNAGKSIANLCVRHKGRCDRKGIKHACTGYPSAICTLDYRPHCGSDGRSYSNECDYCNHQVKDNSLTLLYRGHCYDEHPPCE